MAILIRSDKWEYLKRTENYDALNSTFFVGEKIPLSEYEMIVKKSSDYSIFVLFQFTVKTFFRIGLKKIGIWKITLDIRDRILKYKS